MSFLVLSMLSTTGAASYTALEVLPEVSVVDEQQCFSTKNANGALVQLFTYSTGGSDRDYYGIALL